jgi:hypothetical protein
MVEEFGLGRIPANAFMPEELWGPGAQMPELAADGFAFISDRGPSAPPDKRYVIVGFDDETTVRYWTARPVGEREELLAAYRERMGI